VAIATLVNFDQEGPFQQACIYILELYLLHDVYAHEFGLLDDSIVDVEGA
jgi:hypothetical protein